MIPGDPFAIERMFNEIAPRYDLLNDLLSFGLHRLWKRRLIRALSPAKGELWLDICCGTGDLTFQLARLIRPGKAVGVDTAVNQLEIAKKRHSKEPMLSLVFKNSNALETGLESNQFDGVTMAYGLRNVLSIPLALKEILRVLKPNARAGILDFNQITNRNHLAFLFQKFYLRKIVVPICSIFKLTNHYSYIESSLNNFPSGRALEELAIATGFVEAKYITIAGKQMGILLLKA